MVRLLIRLMFVLSAVAAVCGLPADGRAAVEGGGVVRRIVVEGAQRIEPDTVRTYLLVQEGDAFDPARIDRSLKSLFATGMFADVTLRREGDTLVITVVENPIINRIAFEGNRHIEEDALKSEVTLKPRVIYTRTKVQNDVARILTLYRRSGRFAATVEPKIIQLEQNRVDLAFEINEGEATKVRSVRFVGNREYSDSDLRGAIRTKESRWWRFFSSDDTYDPDRLTVDRELLRRYYLAEGFADFRVASAVAELTPDRKDFFITYTLEEGPRYKFGNIDVDVHLRDLKKESLSQSIEKVEAGDWYNADHVEDTIDALTDDVGTLGYAFVDVRPRINRNREAKTIDVTFEVNEGPRVFVERIDIEGNIRTLDQVIRREFRLVEGDAFNSAKLRRSRKRLQNLDFFETVNVEQVPGSAPDKTVIKVDVAEKSTGSLSIGVGYSTVNGPLGDFGIRERNFLGRGQDLKFNTTIAAKKSQIDFSFTEPYFLDRELSAGFDIFHVSTDHQDTSSMDTKSTGGALRTGYHLTEDLSQSVKYTFERSELTNVSTNASRYIRAEEGSDYSSEISQALLYDRRDSRVNPTDGYFMRLSNDLAGLGGSVHSLRTKVDGGKYFPFGRKREWVLGLTASSGYIVGLGEDVRLLDRFFMGGSDMRGFATAGVGPRDITTDDSLGGEWMYKGTAELKVPLGIPDELGITGRVFMDMGATGHVSNGGADINDVGVPRAAVGAGITWVSPFGPVGLDVGYPIFKEDFDRTELLHVNFGSKF